MGKSKTLNALFFFLHLTSLQLIPSSFDTNFFGLIATQRLVLPGIRSYGDRGWILNNTSMGAYFNANLFSCYQSTKHALANMNQVLAEELQPFGTHVMAIESA